MDREQLREIRIQRLEQFARRHGVLGDPAGLGVLIGKKPNQVYNLLHKQSSFGEKVARSIEESAGLPHLWLDGKDTQSIAKLSDEALEIAMELDTFSGATRQQVIATCNDIIRLARGRQSGKSGKQANGD